MLHGFHLTPLLGCCSTGVVHEAMTSSTTSHGIAIYRPSRQVSRRTPRSDRVVAELPHLPACRGRTAERTRAHTRTPVLLAAGPWPSHRGARCALGHLKVPTWSPGSHWVRRSCGRSLETRGGSRGCATTRRIGCRDARERDAGSESGGWTGDTCQRPGARAVPVARTAAQRRQRCCRPHDR